jgi:16S rRNA (uracil1498-N3)-methyltransferase
MNAPRFFCSEPLAPNTVVALPDAVNHHIRVRRLKAGQEIVLFDGSGNEFLANLAFEKSGQATATTGSAMAIDRELPVQFGLIQGIASQDRMDWVVEKAVEMGVTDLFPVTASRSVVKLNEQRAIKRTEHWQRLIVAASEQCGRNVLMRIHPPRALRDTVSACQLQPMLLCHPTPSQAGLTDHKIMELMRAHRAASIIVGPEGGWDEQEVNQWLAAGAQGVSLGRRILRTETAGLVAVAMLTALFDAQAPSLGTERSNLTTGL